jgi:hypothetical protein
MTFSLSLFKNKKQETVLENIDTNSVYISIPEFIFADPQWFYHNEKHTTNVLSNMVIGESYKAAWSKDETQYLLITRLPESIVIVVDDENTIRNRRLTAALPISDEEEDKEIKYDLFCFRYLKFFRDNYNIFRPK